MSSDSEESNMPRLMDRHRGGASSSSEDDERPPLVARPRRDSSSCDDSDVPPPLVARPRVDSSSSDDYDYSGAQQRGGLRDDDRDAVEEEDLFDVPDLVPRAAGRSDSSSGRRRDGSDSSDVDSDGPPPLIRGGGDEDSSSGDSDHHDNARQRPRTRRRRQARVEDVSGSSESSANDSDGPPPLEQRRWADDDDTSDEEDEQGSVSAPGTSAHRNWDSSRSSDDDDDDRRTRSANRSSRSRRNGQPRTTRPSPTSAAASTRPAPPPPAFSEMESWTPEQKDMYRDEKQKAEAMSLTILREALRRLHVETSSFCEKSEFVEAFAVTRVQAYIKDEKAWDDLYQDLISRVRGTAPLEMIQQLLRQRFYVNKERSMSELQQALRRHGRDPCAYPDKLSLVREVTMHEIRATSHGGIDFRGPSARPSSASASRRASSRPQRSPELQAIFSAEKQKAMVMPLGKLKKQLQNMKITTYGFVEKTNFAEAYANAKVDLEIKKQEVRADLKEAVVQAGIDGVGEEWIDEEFDQRNTKNLDQLRKELRQLGVDPSPYKDVEYEKAKLLEAVVRTLLEKKSKSPEQLWREELDRLTADLTPLQLRKKLFYDFHIDSRHLSGKPALVEAYGKALKEKEEREPVEPNDEMADLPLLVPARDPPQTGAWILAPVADEWMALTYAYRDHDGSAIRRTQQYGRFREGSVLIPGAPGRIWVYVPLAKDTNGPCEIYQCTEIGVKVNMKYELPKASQIVTDGDDGLYMLVPTAENAYELIFLSSRYPDGKVLVEKAPHESRLLTGHSEGAWVVHPPSGQEDPGLWYYSKVGEGSLVVDNLDEDCLFAPCNNSSKGLLILQSLGQLGKSKLIRVWRGEQEEQELDVKISDVEKILDDEKGGVFLHYKVGNQWKVGKAHFGSSVVDDWGNNVYPKDSTMCTDGKGNLWVMKKTGKNGKNRSLHYLRGGRRLEEEGKYAARTILGKAV